MQLEPVAATKTAGAALSHRPRVSFQYNSIVPPSRFGQPDTFVNVAVSVEGRPFEQQPTLCKPDDELDPDDDELDDDELEEDGGSLSVKLMEPPP